VNNNYRFKLSTMMFLDIFVWGAWLPLIAVYMKGLGFDPEWQQPLILGTFNLAAFTAMFFSTQFVDRNFAAERFLAVSMLIAGLAMLALNFGWATSFWPFFLLMLLHSLFYVPTISITNSIAFANLRDPQHEFGKVRLWGTIGWIAAAWPFIFILADWSKIPALQSVSVTDWLGAVFGTPKTGDAFTAAAGNMFIAAGTASLALAVFSLILPHTPPRPAQPGSERLAWFEAMKLLRVPYVLILFIVTFFDSAVHQIYFIMTGKYLISAVGIPGNWVTPVMSIGQIAEIGTMAFLGVALKRLGWRTTMVIGILGHAVRFTVFALYPEPWAAITVNILHGICYAFFFATLYIFVDEFFPKDARSSAQGLFNFLILGLGPLVGNFLGGRLEQAFTTQTVDDAGKITQVTDFHRLFLYPAAVAAAAALFLAIFFRPPEKKALDEDPRQGMAVATE
jgi:nucleoside transporter